MPTSRSVVLLLLTRPSPLVGLEKAGPILAPWSRSIAPPELPAVRRLPILTVMPL